MGGARAQTIQRQVGGEPACVGISEAASDRRSWQMPHRSLPDPGRDRGVSLDHLPDAIAGMQIVKSSSP